MRWAFADRRWRLGYSPIFKRGTFLSLAPRFAVQPALTAALAMAGEPIGVLLGEPADPAVTLTYALDLGGEDVAELISGGTITPPADLAAPAILYLTVTLTDGENRTRVRVIALQIAPRPVVIAPFFDPEPRFHPATARAGEQIRVLWGEYGGTEPIEVEFFLDLNDVDMLPDLLPGDLLDLPAPGTLTARVRLTGPGDVVVEATAVATIEAALIPPPDPDPDPEPVETVIIPTRLGYIVVSLAPVPDFTFQPTTSGYIVKEPV